MDTIRRSALTALLAATVCALPLRTVAEVGVLQLYSTPDGEYQAILLEDDQDDGVDRFTGISISMTDVRGTQRSLTLTPALVRSRGVFVDGKRRFLLATRQMSFWLRAQAELPDAFLATDGGTLGISGSVDRQVSVLDLASAVAFDPLTGIQVGSNDALARHPLAIPDSQAGVDADYFARAAPAAVVREYYHAGMDRYFLAATQIEKADLDFGRRSGWERTGKYFRSIDEAALGYGIVTVPVCRYYLPPPLGDTHFFSAFAEECAAVARLWPAAILETPEAFRVALPERTTGLCLPAVASEDPQHSIVTVPVFRSWNGQPDGNHRYTTSVADQTEMVARGWFPEGYGVHGTAMCVDAYDVGTILIPKQKPKAPRRDESR